MSDGAATLQAYIDKLRTLPSILVTAPPKVAEALRAEIEKNVAEGVGPDGAPWPLTKEGKRALVGAAKALHVTSVGTVVIARLDTIEGRHHLGAVRGKVKRPILPTSKIPLPVVKAIDRVLTGEFKAHMGVK